MQNRVARIIIFVEGRYENSYAQQGNRMESNADTITQTGKCAPPKPKIARDEMAIRTKEVCVGNIEKINVFVK